MNILILTPDRVGSTFLQRFITIIMQQYDYGKPVINLHELTNGLQKYHNDHFKKEVLGKPPKDEWGYHQKLNEIVDLLKSADHYKTSRLALYHINNRKDPLEDQLSFYKYLNDNFYIISARRKNLFEHGLSWCIVNESKNLNIFSHEDKIKIFKDIYKRGIYVDTEVMINYLDRYLEYLDWVDNHFNVSTYFHYEKDMNDIENFVQRLNIFPPEQSASGWENMFGVSWNDWNRCHYLISDMSGFSKKVESISYENDVPLLENFAEIDETAILNNQTPLPTLLKRSSLSIDNQNFLQENIKKYSDVYYQITDLERAKILTSSMPIKLQTFAEKAMLIKNFPECLDAYNEWCSKNQKEGKLDKQGILEDALEELKFWYGKK
jgi:hypothetical protein